ncbi:MAG: PDZ domain-containing protein, partial [Blastocatellia bacterium]
PQTMTAGIVSAVGRNLPGSATSTYDYYIQTDASINPGNSGGPLVDMDGKVIGINTLIFTSSGGNQGIGFAIPSSLANKVYAQLVKFGKVERGYLGVYLQPVSRSYAESMGLQNSNGALVADLPNQNTPAARAGLKSGDVIVEVDGKAVKSSKELTEMVAEEPIGKTVPVKYIRDGKAETTSLKIAERPDANGQTLAEKGTEGNPSGKLGLTVENLTPEIAKQLNLKINTGVVIDDVAPGSPADDAGLQKGTVIHRIDRTRVLNKTDLYRALRQLGNAKEVTLQVEQQGSDGMQLAFATLNLD